MKDKYKVDKNNRLIVIRKGKKLVPQGRFSLEEDNRLSYIISESDNWRKTTDLPKKIVFEGNWSLEPSGNLMLTLSKTRQQFGAQRLYLKSEIISADSDALVFALDTKQDGQRHKVHLLKLHGKWRSDRFNRICFLVQKAQSRYQALTFKGVWEVNENNSITYSHKRTYQKKKQQAENLLVFKGFWQIRQNDRIAYILDIKNDSYFSFKVHPESYSLIGKRGVIKYRLGIGVKAERLFREKTVALYGAWKFGRKKDLSFEIDYGEGRIKEITFGAGISFLDKNKVVFQLKNKEGKDLGIGVTFSRNKSNAEVFLRLQKSRKDSKIEGGVDIRW